jgi:hypothetical protein
MELLLLLSALICGITGTVRTAVVRAPEVVAASQFASVSDGVIRHSAVRALVMLAARPVAPRPDGYVAPAVFAPRFDAPVSGTRATPERRRE